MQAGLSKVHFVSSHPRIVQLGSYEFPTRYEECYNLKFLVDSYRYTKEKIKLVCVDSVTSTVVETWILSVSLSYIEVIPSRVYFNF